MNVLIGLVEQATVMERVDRSQLLFVPLAAEFVRELFARPRSSVVVAALLLTLGWLRRVARRLRGSRIRRGSARASPPPGPNRSRSPRRSGRSPSASLATPAARKLTLTSRSTSPVCSRATCSIALVRPSRSSRIARGHRAAGRSSLVV